MKKGSLHCHTISLPTNYEHNDTWQKKTWGGYSDWKGAYIWSDGTNIYYSNGATHYVLNGNTWKVKAWKGLTDFDGLYVWTDGVNIYYSHYTNQYVLNGDTWTPKEWVCESFELYSNGALIYGDEVWSDGTNFYCIAGQYVNPHQYVLDGNTWKIKTWAETSFIPTTEGVWSDGKNIYASYNTSHYVLNGDKWETKTWNNCPEHFWARDIWSDGVNVYCAASEGDYVLNGDTWEAKTWEGLEGLQGGDNIWSDGKNIYFCPSFGFGNYVLGEPAPINAWQNSDIYKRVNNQWVKHSALKITSGEWSKQDEYRSSYSAEEPTQEHTYWYNDVELPALPKWNEELYPYAAIDIDEDETALRCYKTTLVYDGTKIVSVADDKEYLLYELVDGAWGFVATYDTTGKTIFGELVWTSHDVLNQDGSVYFEASEPVPARE